MGVQGSQPSLCPPDLFARLWRRACVTRRSSLPRPRRAALPPLPHPRSERARGGGVTCAAAPSPGSAPPAGSSRTAARPATCAPRPVRTRTRRHADVGLSPGFCGSNGNSRRGRERGRGRGRRRRRGPDSGAGRGARGGGWTWGAGPGLHGRGRTGGGTRCCGLAPGSSDLGGALRPPGPGSCCRTGLLGAVGSGAGCRQVGEGAGQRWRDWSAGLGAGGWKHGERRLQRGHMFVGTECATGYLIASRVLFWGGGGSLGRQILC